MQLRTLFQEVGLRTDIKPLLTRPFTAGEFDSPQFFVVSASHPAPRDAAPPPLPGPLGRDGGDGGGGGGGAGGAGEFPSLSGEFPSPSGEFLSLRPDRLSGEYPSLNGEFLSPSGEFLSPSGEFLSLSGEFPSPSGEFLSLRPDRLSGEYPSPSGEFLSPSGEFSSPSGEFSSPSGELPSLQMTDLGATLARAAGGAREALAPYLPSTRCSYALGGAPEVPMITVMVKSSLTYVLNDWAVAHKPRLFSSCLDRQRIRFGH
eukprot:1194590-Prorocentrum_minimum.AAC.1